MAHIDTRDLGQPMECLSADGCERGGCSEVDRADARAQLESVWRNRRDGSVDRNDIVCAAALRIPVRRVRAGRCVGVRVL